LAFYLDDNGKVKEVKSRGLPLKKTEKAQAFLDNVLKAWQEPYDPESVSSFKSKTRPPGRHASVEIRAFMPLASAIVSPNKFPDFFSKLGDVTKTVWLDDCGGKRTINDFDLDYLAREAIPTSPKENPTPEVLSAMRFPDWVENTIREEKRQEAAVNQFYKIEAAEGDEAYGYFANGEDEIAAWGNFEDDEEAIAAAWGRYIDDEADVQLYQLLEANEDIEV
jgi:hypothetical protein